MKKKITCILICLLLIGSVIVGAGISKIEETEITDGTISVKIPIGSYEIESTEFGDEISIEDFGHLLIPGMPNLPTKIFSIAIPPGAELHYFCDPGCRYLSAGSLFEHRRCEFRYNRRRYR